MKTIGPRIFSMMLTFILAFLIATNISSYQNAEIIEDVRKSAIKQIEDNPYWAEASEESESLNAAYVTEIKEVLTARNYRKSSLHRIVGNIICFIGLMLIRFRKPIGVHFIIGGTGFVLFSGFFIFGINIVGWAMNIGYIILLGMMLLYYYWLKKDMSKLGLD